jgi:hypothetical protein
MSYKVRAGARQVNVTAVIREVVTEELYQYQKSIAEILASVGSVAVWPLPDSVILSVAAFQA